MRIRCGARDDRSVHVRWPRSTDPYLEDGAGPCKIDGERCWVRLLRRRMMSDGRREGARGEMSWGVAISAGGRGLALLCPR